MRADRRPIPLNRRRLDWVFIFVFSSFALTSFCFDRLAAIHADLEGQEGFFVEFLVHYGKTIDPLVLANPLWLRIMSGLSAFVMGPFYLLLVWALIRGHEWIRLPAIVYACIISYSMIVHLGVEFLGDLPPANTPLLLAIYAPYLVFPLWLMKRMAGRHPFSRPR